MKKELRNGGGGSPEDRKPPIKHWLLGGAGALFITAIILSVFAVMFDYNFKVTLTGVEFSANEEVQVAVLSDEEKAGLLTKNEKDMLLDAITRLTTAFEKMDDKDMTVSDIIEHIENPNLHAYNYKTGERNQVLQGFNNRIIKLESK